MMEMLNQRAFFERTLNYLGDLPVQRMGSRGPHSREIGVSLSPQSQSAAPASSLEKKIYNAKRCEICRCENS